MSRPTPIVLLTEDEVASLQTYMRNSPENSSAHKRAAVLLACAAGKKGNDIADEFNIAPNTVTTWRRKFEEGRVEGLMSGSSQTGRPLVCKDEDIAKIREMIEGLPPERGFWTCRALAEHLGFPESSIRKALKQLGMRISEKRQGIPDIVLPDLTGKQVHIIGFFLSSHIQLLALAMGSSSEPPLFPVEKDLTVVSGSPQNSRQIRTDALYLDLAYTVRCLSQLSPCEDVAREQADAALLVGTLQQFLAKRGKQLSLVFHALDTANFSVDRSLVGMDLASAEEFRSAASLWFGPLSGSSQLAGIFSRDIGRLLDTAPSPSEPFVWQAAGSEEAF